MVSKVAAFSRPSSKAERFALAVFQEQFAVVGALQRVVHESLDPAAVHAGAGKEQVVFGHGVLRILRGKKPARNV